MVAYLQRMVGQLRDRSYPSLTIDFEVLPTRVPPQQPVRSTCRDRCGTSLTYPAEQLQDAFVGCPVLPSALQITGTIDINRFRCRLVSSRSLG